MAEHYRLEGERIPTAARVVSLQGTDAISEVYRFEIALLVTGADFPLDGVVGSRAVLSVGRQSATPLVYHGVLQAVEHLHEWEGVTIVKVVLVPALFNTGLNQHSRVFIDKTVLEIALDTLQRNGFSDEDYLIRTSGTFAPRDFVCQYRESDFDFLARQLERAGLYFFFEQGDARERLVITDDKGVHTALRKTPVRYVPTASRDASASEALRKLRCQMTALPSSVELDDYDYLKPDLDLAVKSAVAEGVGGAFKLTGMNYTTVEEGNKLATVQSGALAAKQRVYHSTGNAIGIRAGYFFSVEGHPRDKFDREYLATRVKISAREPYSAVEIDYVMDLPEVPFEIQIEAIESDVQYRSPLERRPPKVEGYETGIIDGEADSEFAQIDEHGRYKVRFLFDESGLAGGKASTWVRHMQPTGGGTEGIHFPLRKGTEVMVSFIGGDPDRPVISGAAPNAHKPSPVDGNSATKNVLQSGSGNRMEMDDDEPYVDISSPTEDSRMHLGAPNDKHAEHVVINTAQDGLFNFGTDFDTNVGGEKFESVKGNVTTVHNSNESHSVSGNRSVNVNGKQDVVVMGKGGGSPAASLNVTGDYRVDASGNIEVQAPKHIKLSVGDSQILIEPDKITLTSAGKASIVLDINVLAQSSFGSALFVSDPVNLSSHVGANLTLHQDATLSSLHGSKVELSANAIVEAAQSGGQLKLDGKATVSSQKETILFAPKVLVQGINETEVNGGGGASTIKADPAGVTVTAPKIALN